MFLFYKKYILYIVIFILTSWTLIYLHWHTSGTKITTSSWTCQGEGRHKICQVSNFCIDRRSGPFIVHPTESLPQINMLNADETIWFETKRVNYPVNAVYINETLFVYGLYSPFHFSHFLYNGLMPLYSTMQEYGATLNSWTLRVATQWNKHQPVDMLLPGNKDIVLEASDVLSDRQMLPTYKPMCFAKAVIGTGNRCSLWHCDKQIPSQHYASYKDYVLAQPIETNNTCLASTVTHKSTGQIKVGILNRKHTRHITNIPELIHRLSQEQDSTFSIVTMDFDQLGCDITHTAQAVKDLDILIAPFGNGLGAGLFMKDDSVLISISARWYSEDWFKYPMTAIGRRIFNFECQDTSCQEYETQLAADILKEYGVTLNKTEMQAFVTEKYPEHVMRLYLPGKEWSPIYQYQKDVARRVDVDRFIPYLYEILKSKPDPSIPYPETCQKESVCCDLDCGGPLSRNIFGDNPAWK